MPTAKELRVAAVAELKLTTAGWSKVKSYPPAKLATTHWGKGLAFLSQISGANAAPRDAAVVYLKKTTKGYSATATNWKLAFAELAKITDAAPSDWMKIADEYQPFTLAETSEVRYGKNTAWTSKVLAAGTYECGNELFGDPLSGTVKQCDARAGVVQPPPPPPPTGLGYVYSFGDPNYGNSGWTGQITSRGWSREAQAAHNDEHVDFDVALELLAGYPSMRCTIFPNDPPDSPSQDYIHSLVQSFDDRLAQFGSQPPFGTKQGQEWWYGAKFKTNPEFTPSNWGQGVWNNIYAYHDSLGDPGGRQLWSTGIQMGIALQAPAGAVPGSEWDWDASYVALARPHLILEINGGLVTDPLGSPNQTSKRYLGPPWSAGAAYSIIWHIKWDAFQRGTCRTWVNNVLYVNKVDNVSNLFRIGSTPDDGVYFQHQNYRHIDPEVRSVNSIYYSPLVRGTTKAQVTVP